MSEYKVGSYISSLLRKENANSIKVCLYYSGYLLSYMCDSKLSGWNSRSIFDVYNNFAMLRELYNLADYDEYKLYTYISDKTNPNNYCYPYEGLENPSDEIDFFGGSFDKALRSYYNALFLEKYYGVFSKQFSDACNDILENLKDGVSSVSKQPSIQSNSSEVSCCETTEFLYTLQNLYFFNGTETSHDLYLIDDKRYGYSFIPFRVCELMECVDSLIKVLPPSQANSYKVPTKAVGSYDYDSMDDSAFKLVYGYNVYTAIQYLETALYNAICNFISNDLSVLRLCDDKSNIPLITGCIAYLKDSAYPNYLGLQQFQIAEDY